MLHRIPDSTEWAVEHLASVGTEAVVCEAIEAPDAQKRRALYGLRAPRIGAPGQAGEAAQLVAVADHKARHRTDGFGRPTRTLRVESSHCCKARSRPPELKRPSGRHRRHFVLQAYTVTIPSVVTNTNAAQSPTAEAIRSATSPTNQTAPSSVYASPETSVLRWYRHVRTPLVEVHTEPLRDEQERRDDPLLIGSRCITRSFGLEDASVPESGSATLGRVSSMPQSMTSIRSPPDPGE